MPCNKNVTLTHNYTTIMWENNKSGGSLESFLIKDIQSSGQAISEKLKPAYEILDKLKVLGSGENA
jgi:hypothetical protein